MISLDTQGLLTNYILSFVYDPHSIIRNEDSCIQDFLVILKQWRHNYQITVNKGFLGTICKVICLECSNPQPHSSMLFVRERGYYICSSFLGHEKLLTGRSCDIGFMNLKITLVIIFCIFLYFKVHLSCQRACSKCLYEEVRVAMCTECN